MVRFYKQYIAHARHKGPAPENTIALYNYLTKELDYKIIEGDVVFTADGVPVLNHGIIIDAFINGRKKTIDINSIPYDELRSYSLIPNSVCPITSVEEFVGYASKEKICIMLDLTFQKYTKENYKVLYDIVKEYNMKDYTIWGDPNFWKLSRIDRNLICQTSGSWGKKLLVEAFIKSFFCKKMIMSYSYYGGNIEQFKKIIQYGHKLGFIMKVATINDKHIADRFWNIGTDLINTDTLTNN